MQKVQNHCKPNWMTVFQSEHQIVEGSIGRSFTGSRRSRLSDTINRFRHAGSCRTKTPPPISMELSEYEMSVRDGLEWRKRCRRNYESTGFARRTRDHMVHRAKKCPRTRSSFQSNETSRQQHLPHIDAAAKTNNSLAAHSRKTGNDTRRLFDETCGPADPRTLTVVRQKQQSSQNGNERPSCSLNITTNSLYANHLSRGHPSTL